MSETTKTAHSRGPWVTGDGNYGVIRQPGTNGRPIALVAGETSRWPFVDGEMLANAWLIASAPDLLAALKALVDAVQNREGPAGPVWKQMEDADVAIAKAEGRK